MRLSSGNTGELRALVFIPDWLWKELASVGAADHTTDNVTAGEAQFESSCCCEQNLEDGSIIQSSSQFCFPFANSFNRHVRDKSPTRGTRGERSVCQLLSSKIRMRDGDVEKTTFKRHNGG